MIGHLYRYPHPTEEGKFLYVGQGAKRDVKHRSGRTSFGRRFYRDFPNAKLAPPIYETVEVASRFELNELETIWMFKYHTWRGYSGGMNLTFPGSQDYKVMGLIGGPIGGLIGGCISGRRNVESGRLASYRTLEHQSKAGRVSGRMNVESGHIQALGRKAVESGQIYALAASGLGGHNRWHVRRDTPNPRCAFCSEQSLVIAFA